MSFVDVPEPPPRGRRKTVVVVAGYLILAAGAYLFARHVDAQALLRALAHTRPVGLVVACLLTLAQLTCRASVFRTLMLPLVLIPWLRAERFMLASSAATALVPGRAGELMRAYLLKRDDHVAVASTAGVTAIEKLVEVLALSLVLAPIPFLLPHLPPWIRKSLFLVDALAAGLWLASALIASRRKLPRLLISFGAGLAVVRRPSLFGRALLASVGSWLIDLGCLLAVMHAVGVAAPAASGMLVILAVNLAIAVPLVPGNLGTFELGAIAALQPFGVSYEQGLAVGILYHLAQVIPIAVLALLDSRFVVKVGRR
jgi:glycosyltransferase 2 family protein